jgi:glycosyltransferase involved in cell wall biosynthesis
MSPLSVVIITRNEEKNIAACIRSAKLVSDDIIVVDSGSEDNTVLLARQEGANVFQISWQGYGYSRNFGADKARHDWIFALDADERVSVALSSSLLDTNLNQPNHIFRFRRINYMGNRKIKFGTPGFETVKRIYHRGFAKWDLSLVHERLTAHKPVRKLIKGHITHFGIRDAEDHRNKAVLYAQLSAEKYFLEGKKANLAQRILSPLFNSLKSYLFQFGFLDGRQGFIMAATIARYSWLKYTYLQQLHAEARLNQAIFSPKPEMKTMAKQTFS